MSGAVFRNEYRPNPSIQPSSQVSQVFYASLVVLTEMGRIVLLGLILYHMPPSGWVYYRISYAMQYSNTALETTALVMHDSNTFF